MPRGTASGLFYDNHPGGTGLGNTAVYGKTAAESVTDELKHRARGQRLNASLPVPPKDALL